MRLSKHLRDNIQAVLQLSDDETRLVRRILRFEGRVDYFAPYQYPTEEDKATSLRGIAERAKIDVPYYVWSYDLPDAKLHVIDRISHGVGVEHLPANQEEWESYRTGPEILYLNSGDTYTTTLMYRRSKDRFFLACWGDLPEIVSGKW